MGAPAQLHGHPGHVYDPHLFAVLLTSHEDSTWWCAAVVDLGSLHSHDRGPASCNMVPTGKRVHHSAPGVGTLQRGSSSRSSIYTTPMVKMCCEKGCGQQLTRPAESWRQMTRLFAKTQLPRNYPLPETLQPWLSALMATPCKQAADCSSPLSLASCRGTTWVTREWSCWIQLFTSCSTS